jgi:hypothetical protein
VYELYSRVPATHFPKAKAIGPGLKRELLLSVSRRQTASSL